MINRLQQEDKKIQNRIDSMYIDKLDGKVSQEFFDQKYEQWRDDQSEIKGKLDKHRDSNIAYIDDGIKILELAQKTKSLYEKQEMHEKSKLLRFVFSNSTWKDGKFHPVYCKPL